jgi:hypothetical protein
MKRRGTKKVYCPISRYGFVEDCVMCLSIFTIAVFSLNSSRPSRNFNGAIEGHGVRPYNCWAWAVHSFAGVVGLGTGISKGGSAKAENLLPQGPHPYDRDQLMASNLQCANQYLENILADLEMSFERSCLGDKRGLVLVPRPY